MKNKILKSASTLIVVFAMATHTSAAETAVLINNVHVFDGKSSSRSKSPVNVLIVDDVIQSISTAELPAPEDASLTLIDGGGEHSCLG
ncbi:hypothetical protein [Pseudomonas peli]|uniref:hypothetical protein n=1 Tax=Pseudomonas peli TaxID=592361 RepID=UPI0024AD1920|nr:hypothetical protein [Pseudomonas peli]